MNATHCRANGVAVCSLAWLDSLFLVGGSNDGCLCVWNTSELDPVCLRTLKGHEGAVTGLAVFKSLTASTSGNLGEEECSGDLGRIRAGGEFSWKSVGPR